MIRALMLFAATLVLSSHPALADSCGTGHTKAAGTSTHTDHHEAADLVDTAVEAGNFKTLVTAIEAAGLVETLKSDGPFTVFAPTDAAFAALPDGTLESLLADTAELQGVLTYHVVAGRVLASDLTGEGERELTVKTVQGQELLVSVGPDGSVTVDGARVTQTDLIAGNGVIHVIDAVVVPESTS
jgi:uncharacterized surface protein with fasciclin (FAS1) repeats